MVFVALLYYNRSFSRISSIWCFFSLDSTWQHKSPQVSKNLLSVLADITSAMVWMVSVLPIITSSSSLFSCFLGIVQSIPSFSPNLFFHWSLSDSIPFQLSRILLSILADHKTVLVWMVSNIPRSYSVSFSDH